MRKLKQSFIVLANSEELSLNLGDERGQAAAV